MWRDSTLVGGIGLEPNLRKARTLGERLRPVPSLPSGCRAPLGAWRDGGSASPGVLGGASRVCFRVYGGGQAVSAAPPELPHGSAAHSRGLASWRAATFSTHYLYMRMLYHASHFCVFARAAGCARVALCAGDMPIFSAALQVQRVIPEGKPGSAASSLACSVRVHQRQWLRILCELQQSSVQLSPSLHETAPFATLLTVSSTGSEAAGAAQRERSEGGGSSTRCLPRRRRARSSAPGSLPPAPKSELKRLLPSRFVRHVLAQGPSCIVPSLTEEETPPSLSHRASQKAIRASRNPKSRRMHALGHQESIKKDSIRARGARRLSMNLALVTGGTRGRDTREETEDTLACCSAVGRQTSDSERSEAEAPRLRRAAA